MSDDDRTDTTDVGETETETAVRSWLAEQADLLTLEEGFDRAQLSGPYICLGPTRRGDAAA